MTVRPSDATSTFSIEVDQRIVAALMATEQGLLDELCRDGLTKEAVNQRAAQLGMTNEFIKRCRLAGTEPNLRTCVKCDARFLSAGPHNRLCRRCPPR